MTDNANLAARLWPDMAQQAANEPPAAAPVVAERGDTAPRSTNDMAKTLWPDMVGSAEKPVADGAESEAKDDAESPAAPEPEAADAAEPEQPTETLEIAPGFEVIAPEGFEEYSAEALEVFAPIVDRTNMSREDAQQLVDIHARAISDTVEAVHTHNLDSFEQLQRDWAAEAKADPELMAGGFKENLARAKNVLTRFAPEGLREELKNHGLSNSPRFIKFLTRVAKAVR